MDLKNDYERLYDHWLKEFQKTDLTRLNQEEFNEYKTNANFLKDYNINQEDNLKASLLKSYQENFEYLLDDFLKIREIKIINTALALQELNHEDIIEAEKLFYQNLVSSIKGFKKVKALSIIEDFEVIIKEKVIEKSVNDEPVIKIEKKEPEIIDEQRTVQKNEIHESIPNVVSDKLEYNYILIRFLKKTPPLVGIDLLNYGPFEKEDVGAIPYKNAKILLAEKFAEKIDVV